MAKGRTKRQYKDVENINKFGDYCVDLIYDYLYKEIEEEFEKIHLTGNLLETVFRQDLSLWSSDKDKITQLRIPATRYDLYLYKRLGIFQYKPYKGSYAYQVNKTGGLSGKHKNYIERMVYNGCINFVNKINYTIVNGKQVEIRKISWRSKYDRL